MDKNNDDFFQREDLKDLWDKLERIAYNSENGFTASMTWTNEQCMDLVYHYYNSRADTPDSEESETEIERFLFYFVCFLEDYLMSEGLDYTDRD